MKYKLTSGRHYRFENGELHVLVAGDVFEPSEAELQAFSDKLEDESEVKPQPEKAKQPSKTSKTSAVKADPAVVEV